MLDRYLFRGKCKSTGLWIYGNLVEYPANWFIGRVVRDGWTRKEQTKVDPATIGQCTGLKDNTKWEQLTLAEKQEWLSGIGNTSENWNGKMIFEGDIIKQRDCVCEVKDECDCSFEVKLVRWDRHDVQTASGEIFEGYCLLDWGRCEVIGNIHDNPSLLEA